MGASESKGVGRMLDLRALNEKEVLAEFETEQFQYDREGGYYLNLEDEKMWTYTYEGDGFQGSITLEILLWEGELNISYSTQVYDESIRKKVSLMAKRLRGELLRLYPECPVKFTQPIIVDISLYERNLSGAYTDQQMDNLNRFFEKEQTAVEKSAKEEVQFHLYGEDGRLLGEAIGLTYSIAEFHARDDGQHLLSLHLDGNGDKRSYVDSFLAAIDVWGYSITYIEPAEEYDTEYLLNMLKTGMIDIEKN